MNANSSTAVFLFLCIPKWKEAKCFNFLNLGVFREVVAGQEIFTIQTNVSQLHRITYLYLALPIPCVGKRTHTPDGVIIAEDGSTNDVTIRTSFEVYTLTNDVLGNVTYLVPYLKHPVLSKLCSKDKYNG